MCLALPGKIISVTGDDAVVDLQGNRADISIALTPGAAPGTWVLVHAGFAIAAIDETEALLTWTYLQEAADAFAGDLHEARFDSSARPHHAAEDAP